MQVNSKSSQMNFMTGTKEYVSTEPLRQTHVLL